MGVHVRTELKPRVGGALPNNMTKSFGGQSGKVSRRSAIERCDLNEESVLRMGMQMVPKVFIFGVLLPTLAACGEATSETLSSNYPSEVRQTFLKLARPQVAHRLLVSARLERLRQASRSVNSLLWSCVAMRRSPPTHASSVQP